MDPLKFTPDTGVPVRSTTVTVTTAVAPLWAMRVVGTISSVMVCGSPAFNGLSGGFSSIELSNSISPTAAAVAGRTFAGVKFNGREAIDEGRRNEAPCTAGEAAGIM